MGVRTRLFVVTGPWTGPCAMPCARSGLSLCSPDLGPKTSSKLHVRRYLHVCVPPMHRMMPQRSMPPACMVAPAPHPAPGHSPRAANSPAKLVGSLTERHTPRPRHGLRWLLEVVLARECASAPDVTDFRAQHSTGQRGLPARFAREAEAATPGCGVGLAPALAQQSRLRAAHLCVLFSNTAEAHAGR